MESAVSPALDDALQAFGARKFGASAVGRTRRSSSAASSSSSSTSSGWSSVKELIKMRRMGRLFLQKSLEDDGEDYVPFR